MTECWRMAEVRLDGITKAYGETIALDNVNLTIDDGAFVVLLGPTGAGKTTVLRMVSGLDRPEKGDVFIADQAVNGWSPAQRNVAMVFQQYSLYPHMTVRENLAFPLKSPLLKTAPEQIRQSISEVAETLQIADKLDNKVTTLSGGEMQRVSIGRALVRNPHIFLMDEPLSSLDAKLRADLRIELKRIQQNAHATFLYVTHDQIEAMTMATHVGVLDEGKIVQFGPPREIYANPVSINAARRLGQPRINILPASLFEGSPHDAHFIGLRPEQITQGVGEESVVTRIEHLGDQTRLHLSFKNHDLVTVTDAHTAIAMGDIVKIQPAHPFYFDNAGSRLESSRLEGSRLNLRKNVMTQFVNNKEDIVTEAIDGVVMASNGRLARLDGYPHIRVVVRNDWDKSKVALVCGGGSGHEPAHAGFVGPGMLTAAVCGDVFASPSVDAVLAGILAVTGPAGCLLIVKNYTGDRLNFGLAAERARAFGLNVRMVIVGDDIALPDLPQPRGIAGTLFVHKIAGALAESGADLDTVAEAADRVSAQTCSIGMSLETCSVPGSPKEERIPEGMAELGLGIHGEPGVDQVPFENAKAAVAAMVAKLAARMKNAPSVVLVNNLGGASVLEMSVLMHGVANSASAGNFSHVIGPATMMTSLDMRGFSLSVFPASHDDINALSAPTPLSAWPGISALSQVTTMPLPDGLRPITAPPSAHPETAAFLKACCDVLIAAEDDLNALDAKSGDGDTGSTLAGAARALISALDRLPLADHTQLFRAIGVKLSQVMGGSSGVLLAIYFAAAGDAASSGLSIKDALKAGLARMQEIGGARLGDRTMVDALHPALEALADGFDAAAKAARMGANHTASMDKAHAGRAAYVNAAQLRGHVDPGAEAVARLFEHMAA
jgi:dihydroxyacetone kinase